MIPSDSNSSAEDKNSEADEFPLAPAEGLSPEERIFRSRHYPAVTEPEAKPPRGQFTIRQWMYITFIVALGLGGGSWVSAQEYAGVLGTVLIVGMLIRAFLNPENVYLDSFLGATGLAYAGALVRALLK